MVKGKWAPYLMETAARAGWGFSEIKFAEASVLLAAEQLGHKGVVPAVPDVLVELSVV